MLFRPGITPPLIAALLGFGAALAEAQPQPDWKTLANRLEQRARLERSGLGDLATLQFVELLEQEPGQRAFRANELLPLAAELERRGQERAALLVLRRSVFLEPTAENIQHLLRLSGGTLPIIERWLGGLAGREEPTTQAALQLVLAALLHPQLPGRPDLAQSVRLTGWRSLLPNSGRQLGNRSIYLVNGERSNRQEWATIRGYDLATGQQRFLFTEDPGDRRTAGLSAIPLPSGVIFVIGLSGGDRETRLIALDDRGEERWRHEIDFALDDFLAFNASAEAAVLFVERRHESQRRFRMLDADTGQVLWEKEEDRWNDQLARVTPDGGVWLTDFHSTSFWDATGASRWEHEQPSSSRGSTSLALGSTTMFYDTGLATSAFDRDRGHLWTREWPLDHINSGLTVIGDRVWVLVARMMGERSWLVELDMGDGSIAREIELPRGGRLQKSNDGRLLVGELIVDVETGQVTDVQLPALQQLTYATSHLDLRFAGGDLHLFITGGLVSLRDELAIDIERLAEVGQQLAVRGRWTEAARLWSLIEEWDPVAAPLPEVARTRRARKLIEDLSFRHPRVRFDPSDELREAWDLAARISSETIFTRLEGVRSAWSCHIESSRVRSSVRAFLTVPDLARYIRTLESTVQEVKQHEPESLPEAARWIAEIYRLQDAPEDRALLVPVMRTVPGALREVVRRAPQRPEGHWFDRIVGLRGLLGELETLDWPEEVGPIVAAHLRSEGLADLNDRPFITELLGDRDEASAAHLEVARVLLEADLKWEALGELRRAVLLDPSESSVVTLWLGVADRAGALSHQADLIRHLLARDLPVPERSWLEEALELARTSEAQDVAIPRPRVARSWSIPAKEEPFGDNDIWIDAERFVGLVHTPNTAPRGKDGARVWGVDRASGVLLWQRTLAEEVGFRRLSFHGEPGGERLLAEVAASNTEGDALRGWLLSPTGATLWTRRFDFRRAGSWHFFSRQSLLRKDADRLWWVDTNEGSITNTERIRLNAVVRPIPSGGAMIWKRSQLDRIASDGRLMWSRPIDDRRRSTEQVVVAGGHVFLSTGFQLRTFDLATGELQWHRSFESPLERLVESEAGLVVAPWHGADGTVRVLSPLSGETLRSWTVSKPHRPGGGNHRIDLRFSHRGRVAISDHLLLLHGVLLDLETGEAIDLRSLEWPLGARGWYDYRLCVDSEGRTVFAWLEQELLELRTELGEVDPERVVELAEEAQRSGHPDHARRLVHVAQRWDPFVPLGSLARSTHSETPPPDRETRADLAPPPDEEELAWAPDWLLAIKGISQTTSVGEEIFAVIAGSRLEIRRSDGTSLFEHELDDEARVPAVLAFGDSYTAAALSGAVTRLSPAGEVRWTKDLGGPVLGGLASSRDGAFIAVAGPGRRLTALDPDGAVLWETEAPGTTVGPPVVDDDGTVMVATADRWVAGFRAGGRVFALRTLDEIRAEPVRLPGTGIVVATTGGHVHAVGPDGDLSWSHRASGAVERRPAILEDGRIAIVTQEGWLELLDPAGRLLRRLEVGTPTTAPVATSEGTVYGMEPRSLWRFDSRGDRLARVRSRYSWPGTASLTPLPDGTLIVQLGELLCGLRE